MAIYLGMMLPKFAGNLKEYAELTLQELSALCVGVCCPYCKCRDVIQWGYRKRKVLSLVEAIVICIKSKYESSLRFFDVL